MEQGECGADMIESLFGLLVFMVKSDNTLVFFVNREWELTSNGGVGSDNIGANQRVPCSMHSRRQKWFQMQRLEMLCSLLRVCLRLC